MVPFVATVADATSMTALAATIELCIFSYYYFEKSKTITKITANVPGNRIFSKIPYMIAATLIEYDW